MNTSTVPVKRKYLTPEDQTERSERVKLCSLVFTSNAGVTPSHCRNFKELDAMLSKALPEPQSAHTRLIVVEDLSSTVIEALGSKFDIDPRFFRAHFGDYTWYNVRDPWVELPELESAWRNRSFFSLRYVQARFFEDKASAEAAERQAGSFNVLRRIDRAGMDRSWANAPDSDLLSEVGLVRSKLSLWVRKNKPEENGWLGMSRRKSNTGSYKILTLR